MDYKREILYLEKQLEFLDEAILAIAPNNIGYLELTSVIGPLLKLTLDTGKSIKLLAENNHIRDLIILSRPFIEGIINVGFICAKDKEAILKSKKYAFQKGYRDLFKHLNIEVMNIRLGLSEQHKEEIDKHRPQHLIEALEDFTTKRGKEVTSWTNETTKEKIEIISAKYGQWANTLLNFAFFNIYRDVSEIIHGSYYGVRIFLGMQTRDMDVFKSSEEAAKYFTEHQFKLGTLILQQISISIVAIIDILEQQFKNLETISDIRVRSKQTLDEYAERVMDKDVNLKADVNE